MQALLKNSRKIAEGHNSLIYFNDDETFQQPVILKTLKDEFNFYPHYTHILNEDTYIRDVKIPGVRGSLELLTLNDKQVLVLEYFEGNTLKEWITKGNHSIIIRLKIAIKICRGLNGVHEHNILHRDLNSYNILINTLGEINIIDFGLSTSLSVKPDVKGLSKYLEGTLPYISPEQTGRMNHVIDHRADLYSFGIILYEMFTGRLPFISTDPMEMVHAHLAKSPEPPDKVNPEVPRIISDIILKLLSKNVEDRYQSSFGLLTDLERCLKQLELKVQIQNFDLATNDRSGKFLLPSKLYGRKKEVKTLLDSFARIGKGQKEMTLIEGYAGTGKTSLVYEIHKPVALKNGYFIHGKHEQFQKDVPYLAISQAINSLMEYILSEKEEKLKEWKKLILKAVGNEGKLLTDIIPKLELVIGAQKDVEALGINEAQNRFTYTFIQFLKAIATERSPVVMFVDDLQWADGASLALLKNIIADPELHYFYFIGAYRDHEVNATHPAAVVINDIQKQDILVNRIKTKDLTIDDLEELIKDVFANEVSDYSQLVDIVFNKTHGNPFFVNQFLQSMYEDGFIRFEVDHQVNEGQWVWDVEGMKKMNFTDNVVEFMLIKIKSLDEEVQEILKFASCIGDSFDLQTIQYISDKPLKTIASALWKALQEQYIVSNGNQHDFTRLLMRDMNQNPENPNLGYTFVHDRIRQAAYELIPDAERAQLHQKIGGLLLDNIEPRLYEESIFEIVYQLNRGGVSNLSAEKRLEFARLNFLAGRKAKSSSAYQTALSYFEIAIETVEEDHWEKHHSFVFDVHFHAMECAYLMADYNRMEQLGQLLLAHSENLLESTRVKNILIYALIAQNKHVDLIEFGLKVLKDLGVRLPRNPKNHHIILELIKTKWRLRKKDKEYLERLPPMQDEKIQLAINIMSSISTASYHNLPKLFPLAIFKAIQLSLKFGNATESISFYGGYGSILCGVTNEPEKGFEFGRLSLELLDGHRNTKYFRPKTYVIFSAFINHWKEHLQSSLEYLKKAYLIGMESGDPQYAASALFLQSYSRFLLGENLELLISELNSFSPRMAQLNQDSYSLYFKIFFQGILNLRLKNGAESYLTGDVFNESEFYKSSLSHDKTALFHIHYSKFYLNYLFGKYVEASRYARETEKFLEVVLSTYYIPLFHFYDSLVSIAVYPGLTKKAKAKLLRKIRANQKKMAKWKDAAPMNFLHKYLLVEAELNAYCYENQKLAIQNYKDSIRLAEEAGYVNELALASELAGKYFGKINLPEHEAKFIQKAYEAYSKWGARSKEKQLLSLYPHILAKTGRDDFVSSQTYTSQLNTNSLLDLSTILKASTAISSEIKLEKVIQKLLNIVVENAGAQSGYFLLYQNEEPKMYTSIDINGNIKHDIKSITNKADLFAYSVVQFVCRTKENLIIKDIKADERFAADPYVQNHSLASMLCCPVSLHGNLLGIIYLENNAIKGAFTPQRLEILNMLSGQIAITINNALLYENLECKVHERTEEINRQKEQLKQQNIDLQNINKEKDDLINVVSHDLRSPLNQIKGLAELAAMVSSEAEVKDFIKKITEATDRLNHMIVRILDISAIESQKVQLQFEEFDAILLITNLVRDFETVAGKKNIRLYAEANVKTGVINLDKVHLIQILENLISNAIKFSDENKPVLVKTFYQADGILIEVKDEGPGISEDDQKRLFHKFQRLSARPTGGEKSVGLGLSIVKKYVEAMGGKIWCKSQLHQGSSFFVRFPFQEK